MTAIQFLGFVKDKMLVPFLIILPVWIWVPLVPYMGVQAFLIPLAYGLTLLAWAFVEYIKKSYNTWKIEND